MPQAWFLLLGGLGLAFELDQWAGNDWPVILACSVFGSFIAYIYSAPPLKLKAGPAHGVYHPACSHSPLPGAQANGWTGTYALGASYIALPWWCVLGPLRF